GNTTERGYAVFASLAFLIVLEPSGSAMPDLMLMIILVALAAVAFALAFAPARRWIEHVLAVLIEEFRTSGIMTRIGNIAPRAPAHRGGTSAAANTNDSLL